MACSALRVVTMERSFPAMVEFAEFGDWFCGGKSGAAAIDLLDSFLFNFKQHVAKRAQVRAKQLDENSSQKKIESAESDERGRIVKHSAGIFFGDTALFHKTLIHKIAESPAVLSGFQNYVQRFAAFEFSNFNFAEHRLKNACNVSQIY